jgi:hypothetical protein
MKTTMIIAIFLIVMAIVLTACSTTPPQTKTPPIKPTPSEQAPEPPVEATPTKTPTPTQLAPARPTMTIPPTTQTPIPTKIPIQPSELVLEILSVTSPVKPGANATLVAQTVPGASCAIKVIYKSGPGKAQGLNQQTADSQGKVS